MNVIFMGTPDFAVNSLCALLETDDFNVKAVVTQPDKPVGRGLKMSFSPVKTTALNYNIPLFQPESLKDVTIYEKLKSFEPDFIVVVAYGKILPDSFLNMSKYGAINLHASLLPKYRGAAPIQWSILNGDDYTGITTMFLASKMDTGDLIYNERVEISEYMTSGELSSILSKKGSELLIKTLHDVFNNSAPRIQQTESEATYVKMLDKSVSMIDWSCTQKSIIRKIYGLQPWPAASGYIKEFLVKIYAAEYTNTIIDEKPGTIIKADKKGIEISCADNRTVLITKLQLPGKKVMSASDFLNGHKIY